MTALPRVHSNNSLRFLDFSRANRNLSVVPDIEIGFFMSLQFEFDKYFVVVVVVTIVS